MKPAYVKRPNMARKMIERSILPNQFLSPVRHMFVAKWTGAHGV